MTALTAQKCKPCEGGVDPLKPAEVETLLKQLKGWTCVDGTIAKNQTTTFSIEMTNTGNQTIAVDVANTPPGPFGVGASTTLPTNVPGNNGMGTLDITCLSAAPLAQPERPGAHGQVAQRLHSTPSCWNAKHMLHQRRRKNNRRSRGPADCF